MQRVQAAVLAATIVVYAPLARAQASTIATDDAAELVESEEMFGTFQGTYLSVGPSVGLGFAPSALLLGGEVSLVRQTREFFWFGAYVDLVHDFGHDQTRLSVGPEFGWSALGLDVGYVVSLHGDGSAALSVRPMLTMGFVTVFGRVLHPVAGEAATAIESGLLVKYPFEL